MARRSAPVPVNCPVCDKQINRKADLGRHMKVHAPNKDALMLSCPHEGCNFKTLQKSNLATHLNRHLGERPHACPSCTFCTSDPASLLRHRVRKHGYIPKSDSSSESDSEASVAAADDTKADESIDSESSSTGALVPVLRNSSPAFDTALTAGHADANSLQLTFDAIMPQSHLATGQMEMFNDPQLSLSQEDPVNMSSLFTETFSDLDLSFGELGAYLRAYNNSHIEGAPLAPISTALQAPLSMTCPTVDDGSVASPPLYVDGYGNNGAFSLSYGNGCGNNEQAFYANGNGDAFIPYADAQAVALGPQYDYGQGHVDDALASYVNWNDFTLFATNECSQVYPSAPSLPCEYGDGRVSDAPASYANGNDYTSCATHGYPQDCAGIIGFQYGNNYVGDAFTSYTTNGNASASYAVHGCPELYPGAFGSQYGNALVDDAFTSYGNDYTHATPESLQDMMQQLNSVTVPDIDFYPREGNQNTMYTIPDGTASYVF